MRIILAAALPLTALLAACSGSASTNAAEANAANAAAPAATPAANDAKPAADPQAHAVAGPRREGEIAECEADVRGEIEPGADLHAFCGCAVDRIATGLGEREAMEQCAAEMGVRQRGR